VYERLTTVCHLWPGITPLNVWNLQYPVWLMFAAQADAWAKEQKEASRNG